MRDNFAADDRIFVLRLGVGEHGKGGDLAAGAVGRRNTDEGGDVVFDVAAAQILVDTAAIIGDYADHFGHVHR